MIWVAVLLLLATACSDESEATPDERACRKILDWDGAEEPGKLESEVAEDALDHWRDVWEDAQDASNNIRRPAERILQVAVLQAEDRHTVGLSYGTMDLLALDCEEIIYHPSSPSSMGK